MTGDQPYQADADRLARARDLAQAAEAPAPGADGYGLNPSLVVEPVAWSGLPALLAGEENEPRPGEEPLLAAAWKTPAGGVELAELSQAELLALKVVAEEMDPAEAARQGGVLPGVVLDALDQAVERGLLLRPPSLLTRTAPQAGPHAPPEFLASDWFTLQWHITQSCDLSCRHCYDRSDRPPVSLEQGLEVIEQMAAFCGQRRVRGQISFTGGNPLLHPDFSALYQAAAQKGLAVALLANPCGRDQLEHILAMAQPTFFQVSLEGLEAHNDYIRGPGHYQRTMKFLDLLQELGVYSMVMLTLSRDNQDQVIPLARRLEGKVDQFNFNRLTLVGQGASLTMAGENSFRDFLQEYAAEAGRHPHMFLKDNLLNLLAHEQGGELFGGCTGYGCGAAFNFLAVLPEGEVHACRKFPSPLGNLFDTPLAELYDGESARRYRAGPAACGSCRLRAVCGGCLAVAHGAGLDVFAERDPFCWLEAPLA
ncbi:MAG: selenobiotic family peptide radical SAM maturase [Desulfarculaceae bacterium]|nr:selenobiotic family peptide radical SAM maturase [Desulfarculaceae bacterium]MCF8073779.1 selenobiotic family peptide radical SAM maturase [Desulfarculaceae bacterium]MCF8102020.1 selenobiotic family peptide radical SAM maturase [Desulfarculaceae bacterium]MCF8115990.1 selenobiotic family peptide radical SAM maturase [Desulfarculaceae bacterium]